MDSFGSVDTYLDTIEIFMPKKDSIYKYITAYKVFLCGGFSRGCCRVLKL
jgi:hypothetical protein